MYTRVVVDKPKINVMLPKKRIYLKRKAIASIPAITPSGSPAPMSEMLPKAIKHIARQLNPDQIILFGSYAYGTPTPDSDVDLLVVMETEETRPTHRAWSVGQLLLPRLFAVDILIRTPAELNGYLRRNHLFYKEIVSKGKVLYER